MRKDMLVKVEAQYPISGGPPILVSGGGGRGGARGKRERFGRAIGGAVGGLGAIAGKHRSLGSLLQSIVSGYAQGKDLGGGFGRALVSPERQAVIDYRHAKRMAEAKANAANAPTMARRLGRGVGQLQNFANRFKQTPVEEVAVTPEGRQLPAQAGVIGPEFQLNAPPSKVAVEPLALPAPRPDVPIADFEIIDDDMERGVEEANPFRTSRTAVRRPVEPGASRADRVGSQVYVQHRSRTEGPSDYMSRQVPTTEEDVDRERMYADFDQAFAEQDAANQQAASDAALQANAAAATQKVMVTPPPLPLQTTGGANAELLAGENAATFAETPVTDDKRGDGGPTVAQAGQQAAQDIGVAVEQGRRQTPGEKMMERGFPNIRPDLEEAGEDASSLMASEDRLPTVGIRKARTRRVLIV
jgi:hypothetical protein